MCLFAALFQFLFLCVAIETIDVSGEATSEHSWFPGFCWQMANCRACQAHLGWAFSVDDQDEVADQRRVANKDADPSVSSNDPSETIVESASSSVSQASEFKVSNTAPDASTPPAEHPQTNCETRSTTEEKLSSTRSEDSLAGGGAAAVAMSETAHLASATASVTSNNEASVSTLTTAPVDPSTPPTANLSAMSTSPPFSPSSSASSPLGRRGRSGSTTFPEVEEEGYQRGRARTGRRGNRRRMSSSHGVKDIQFFGLVLTKMHHKELSLSAVAEFAEQRERVAEFAEEYRHGMRQLVQIINDLPLALTAPLLARVQVMRDDPRQRCQIRSVLQAALRLHLDHFNMRPFGRRFADFVNDENSDQNQEGDEEGDSESDSETTSSEMSSLAVTPSPSPGPSAPLITEVNEVLEQVDEVQVEVDELQVEVSEVAEVESKSAEVSVEILQQFSAGGTSGQENAESAEVMQASDSADEQKHESPELTSERSGEGQKDPGSINSEPSHQRENDTTTTTNFNQNTQSRRGEVCLNADVTGQSLIDS
mmetsp:Transcript_22356/g.44351  ORF Transcript_22356/g.44351 Transcript_22356/m.44351 type:complete len:539 (-) Transcript_22356:73-1689(-)